MEYLQRYYFADHRVIQWASWYRRNMYGCKWLLHTNMHVESFHNHLKTDILERKKNTRVDTLLKVLRALELHYFWKWSRVNAGQILNVDPAWRVMHGNTAPTEKETRDRIIPEDIPPETYFVSKRAACEDIFTLWDDLVSFFLNRDNVKSLSTNRQKSILDHLKGIKTICHTGSMYKGGRCFVKVEDGGGLIIPSVKKQYSSFKRTKKRRKPRSVMTVRKLKNESNRSQHAISYHLNVGHDVATPSQFVNTTELKLTLKVVRTKSDVTLGGIMFAPMIGGLVIPHGDNAMETLNVRVLRVKADSDAKEAGVHTGMYLKSLALIDTSRTPPVSESPVIIGSSCCRLTDDRTPEQVKGDVFRTDDTAPEKYTMQFGLLITKVDYILSRALARKNAVQVVLLSYK